MVKTPVARPGGTVELALVMRAEKPLDGWRLFTHLVAGDGRRINADHQLLEGLLPLEQLAVGLWVRDRIHVVLPPDWPPGPLTVEVGLWKRGHRAPARGPHSVDDAVHAATIRVQP